MTEPTRWLPQFSRFVLVGAVCTGIQYAILGLGVEWLGLSAVAASTIGFLLGAVANYLLNRRYTFNSAAPHVVSIGKFAAVVSTGLLLNALFMQLLHGYLHWGYVLAQLFATGGTLIWNFCAHRCWTFSRSKA